MLSAAFLLAQLPAEPFLRFPDISGDRVVYTSEGDLWLGDLKTGDSKRITSDVGLERNASFSPDGKWIAFEGEYDGARQAYLMASGGGAPKRLTSVEEFRAVTGWTPDGENIVFRRRQAAPTNYEQMTVPAKGGAPARMPLEFSSHVAFGKTSKQYTFTRFNRWYMNWFRYIGGMQNQIWVANDSKFKQITNVAGTNEYPVWVGDRIFFVNEKDSKFTLMSVGEGGGAVRNEGKASDVEIRELATDGTRVIYEKGPDIEIYDPATKSASKPIFANTSDLIHTRTTFVDPMPYIQNSALSPSAKRVLVETRGQIVSLPVGEGEARVLKVTPGVRYRSPAMSYDGKKLAYFSDATGEMQLYIANADGTSEKQLTTDKDRQLVGCRFSPDGKWIALNDSTMHLWLVNVENGEKKKVVRAPFVWRGVTFDFSPDSKWVVYQMTIPVVQTNVVELFEVATGKVTRVSDSRSDDTSPVFSSDGKYLAFLSKRHIAVAGDPIQNQLNTGPMTLAYLIPCKADGENPFLPKDTVEPPQPPAKPEEKKEEFRLDTEGMWERRIETPLAPANYGQIAMFGTRILTAGDGRITFYDIDKKTGGTLVASGAFLVSPDNSRILFGLGGKITVMSPRGEDSKDANLSGLRLEVQPVKEWTQMFWDGWRLLRDYFYVANMHGVDWPAIGKKYAAYLPRVRSRDELDELLRWMQSEIGSSHEYLQPGDMQDIKRRTQGAYLGIDVEPTPSGFYRITKIVKGDGFRPGEQSPLMRYPGKVKEGMYLIEVAGMPAKVGHDFLGNLSGRAGQTISIKVNTTPSETGATTLMVQPVGSELRMRYLDWVEQNRLYVEKHSNGRVGYVHLAAMTAADMNDFIKQYFPQRNKEALVIDTRFNGGGNVQDYVNRILSSRLTGFFNMRDSTDHWTRQGDYFLGPMACLMNEFNVSCGEEFPHRFKDLKLGPLIGRRTMGGEVGSDPGWPLADGGIVSVPNYGMWTPNEGWVIEGEGVKPDIDVPSDPNAYIEGRDPQMDKAIEWLLDDLKKNPRNRGTQPKDRDRTKGGGK